jgi:hypothetical protein
MSCYIICVFITSLIKICNIKNSKLKVKFAKVKIKFSIKSIQILSLTLATLEFFFSDILEVFFWNICQKIET